MNEKKPTLRPEVLRRIRSALKSKLQPGRFNLKNPMIALRTSIVLLLCAATSPGADLRTLAGKTISGELVSVSDKQIVFRGPGGQAITMPINEVLQIDFHRDGVLPGGIRYSDIELTDGSLLHCSRLSMKGSQVAITLANTEQKVQIPLSAVRYLLNEAQESSLRQEWQEKFLNKKRSQDVLAFKLEGVISDLEGTLGGANDKGEISFEYDAGGERRKREIDPGRTQGLIFVRPPAGEPASPLCKVFDVNQNVLVAGKLVLGVSNITVTTLAGVKIEYPLLAIARLDYSNDKVVYLSDLKPAEVISRSRQGRKDLLGIDKNLENGTLQLKGDTYAKGLAIHAHTELVYNLDGKYLKFEGILGIDDMVGGDGQPLVRIEGDGKELFSGVITRKNKKQELSKDVKGVKQLRIIVSSQGLFDFGDHVDLVNAKLSK
jgi:hypothetical protein